MKRLDGIYLQIRHFASNPKNKKKIKLGAIFLIILYFIVVSFFVLRSPQQTVANLTKEKTAPKIVKELKDKRTLYSKTFLREDNSYQEKTSIGPIHYPDENGNLEDINTNFVSSNDSKYDYEVTKGFYQTKFKKNFNSENLAEYRFHNFITKIQVQDLSWSDEKGEKELISQPQSIEGVVQGNRLIYPNAYGRGIDVEFLYHPQYFGKYLIIDGFDSLLSQGDIQSSDEPVSESSIKSLVESPAAEQTMPANKDFAYLEFNFKMIPSNNLDVYIDNQKWDGQEILTQGKIEFKDKQTNKAQFYLKEPYCEDAEGDKKPIILSLKRQDSDILISKQIDKDWLEQAVYPIRADADTIYLEGDIYDMYDLPGGNVDDGTEVYVSNQAATANDADGYWAFPISGTIIGATINSVTFTGYVTSDDAGAFDIYGLQQENCPALEGAEDPSTYTRTTATLTWDATVGSSTSGDIKTIFNEWVDDYTHASPPDRFGLVFESENLVNKTETYFYDYSHASYSNHTYLVIDYATNQNPSDPTSLAQKKIDDTILNVGDWTDETSVKFTATVSDLDSDQVRLCVEKDALGTGFSDAEDLCGDLVNSGQIATVTITSQTDDTQYHWQARAKDANNAYSNWVSYGANAESERDYGIDTSGPTGGTVLDGTSGDQDWNDGSLDELSANWNSFDASVSGLDKYEYAARRASDDYYWNAGGSTWQLGESWVDNGVSTSVTVNPIYLQTGKNYYFSVRATDNAQNTASPVNSNGQQVSPTLSFSYDTNTITFADLNNANNWTDTKTNTFTSSTNAYSGYTIQGYITQLLTSLAYPSVTVDNFYGTWANPEPWPLGTYGFGYTSNDTLVQGSNRFNSGTEYAAFSQTASGDVVADHTDAVTGQTGAVSSEQFIITYKVAVSSSQVASEYQTFVIYTITANY